MPNTSPQSAWNRVIAAAALPSEHAAVIDARRKYGRWPEPPYAAMLGHYARALPAYSWTDALRLTAVETTDLIRVVDAATKGLPGDGVHAASRHRLARLRLVTLDGGRNTGGNDPDDPTVTVTATIPGIATARAATVRTLVLSSTEIECLARLAADGGCTRWPGSVQAHYVLTHWNLAVHDRDRRLFRLTRLGKEILNTSRDRAADSLGPSTAQREILTACLRSGSRGASLRAFGFKSVRSTLTRNWITRVGGAHPVRYRLTQVGREALAGVTAVRGEVFAPPLTAPHLKQGMRVRMVNREVAGIGAGYVRVDHVTRVSTGGRGQVGWQVWVTDGPEPGLNLYGGRAFHPATQYEVEP